MFAAHERMRGGILKRTLFSVNAITLPEYRPRLLINLHGSMKL